MREIRFRAWDKNHKAMHFSDMAGIDQLFDWVKRHGGAVMQFTGLKDSKNVRIYEDDIVESLFRMGEENRHLTSNKDNPFKRIGLINYIHAEFCLDDTLLSLHKELRVIGNIWENPELLKKDK